MRILPAAAVPADIARLITIIARRMRAIADELSRPRKRARAQVLPHPDIYGLSANRIGSDAGKLRPHQFDSSEHGAAAEAYLPIGPSCC